MKLRAIGAVAAVVSAFVHLYLWFDGVKDQGTVGQLFVVNVVGGLAIAVTLLTWRSWVPPLFLALFGASTLGAFLISWTVGLFGVETGWSWYAWVAAVAEVTAVVVGLAVLRAEGAGRSLREPQDRVSL